ncbi:TRAP transporter large permease subunit, partial [Rhizobium leguminosarum]|uniref:TRAP transporter large permease subunit n=1 Tax=Rhizobium leguminosarum TaxID=384 RepID=UPI003F9D1CD7
VPIPAASASAVPDMPEKITEPMKDHGYPVEAAVGVTAASATIGPIFPPSLPFVIYGMMANVSIGALFMAGILPGIVMTLL